VISVVISTYNREKYLERCLESLAGQSFDKSAYEIVLVNNNSTDSTESIFRRIKEKHKNLNIRYIVEKSQGLSYARNTGIKVSSGDIILFVDDDAFAAPDYIRKIHHFFQGHPDVKAIGGKIVPQFETSRPVWMSKFLMPLVASLDLGKRIRPFPTTRFPIGANMGFSREIFERYGYFNVNLGRKGSALEGGEEKDIFSKLKSDNVPIYYVSDACIYHIIPDNRLSLEFIKMQAEGIGISEWKRVRMRGRTAVLIRSFVEVFKWSASLVLFIYYLLTFQLSKGIMIVRFRYHVTAGFLKRE
jgi:glycosyltransferase involved in cell wall biosynthesis